MSSYKLRRELLDDPLTIGYAAMPDVQALTSLTNTTARSEADRLTLSGSEIFESIDRPEYLGLDAAEKQELQIILALGDTINISSGSKVRSALAGMFGGSSNTATALLALVEGRTQSRAQELGIKQSVLNEDGIAACRLPDQPPGV